MSTKFTSRIQTATHASCFGVRFSDRDSSAPNGRKKWPKIRKMPMPAHRPVEAGDVERHLLGQTRDPDQQQLREGDVGPEAGEGEHQLADVVRVLDVHRRHRTRSCALPAGDEASIDSAAPKLPREVVDAEDRREPRRVQAHQPVEGRERHREPDEGQPAGARLRCSAMQLPDVCPAASCLPRQPQQALRHEARDGDVDERRARRRSPTFSQGALWSMQLQRLSRQWEATCGRPSVGSTHE